MQGRTAHLEVGESGQEQENSGMPEVSIGRGDINTIAGGFVGGGHTSSTRKDILRVLTRFAFYHLAPYPSSFS